MFQKQDYFGLDVFIFRDLLFKLNIVMFMSSIYFLFIYVIINIIEFHVRKQYTFIQFSYYIFTIKLDFQINRVKN